MSEYIREGRIERMGKLRLADIAAGIKREFEVLKYVARHPRLPLRCKLFAGLLVAYALSPIDLIPDFIPVLGQLDDLVILPIGIWILYKMVPADIIEEARVETAHKMDRKSFLTPGNDEA